MAPKRKIIGGVNSSRTTAKRRFSKRVGGGIINDEKCSDVMIQPKQTRLKKKITKKTTFSETDKNTFNVAVDNSKEEENIKSMSIDTNDDSDLMEPPSSISTHFNSQLKPSTHAHLTNSYDGNDEFESMFMTNAPSVKPSNYSSTPLSNSNSRQRNHSDSHTAIHSLPVHQIKNTVCGTLPTLNYDHQTTGPNLYNRNINTPTNPRNISSTLPSRQTLPSVRSLSSVSYTSNNNAILETFSEYRKLKRDLAHAQKQNETWAADYKSLTNRMKKLEAKSFPRPAAEGRLFLEQLLELMKTNEYDEDKRSHAQLAADMGLSEATLMSLSNADPQRTALHVFNACFPTHYDKEYLINVANLTDEHPQLINDIYIFTRRCAPGTGYSMTMLKDAIGNAIRCARHKMKKLNAQVIAATVITQSQAASGIDDVEHMSQSNQGF